MLIDKTQTWNHSSKHLILEAAQEVETDLPAVASASTRLRSQHLRQRGMMKCWANRRIFKYLYTKAVVLGSTISNYFSLLATGSSAFIPDKISGGLLFKETE